ncbi:caspase domain-containing protein [Bradyrhizobium sp. WYCCWR 13022]|uniref:caspase family protein n=1 Tax=unclassified Bradyrhizobium TaxID=2631580 RepID=UPI00263A63B1|nr:caspase domain-containing protein [Bradyrhizobium sp. WYCCWR 13022]MDN4981847.1 caspase domain-containing protein [Bradyrhizobium sp. WYCCWR 13022]
MRGTHKVFLCLLLPILFVAGVLGPVRAQQQEKRIALVVGNGAYSKSPLATTANDAGLIAQTLEAAGFDVVGARDLDGDTLRKSLRDFIQKAQASGPGTVAMIYLSGYGVQLAGENYFIPVDSNITRDTDIPTEALRISDYARQLASIPLKASIIVLDAARAQPFVEGGQQPIASGLALVEPDPNMLIAFNAAPGTVAPEEPGPYGIYAQSLAEMIRTGGLSLPEVFDRVRLRVNENSKGAQVPWDDQKISAQFSFFDRAPDAPPQAAAPDQVAAIRNKPIRDLGVQDAYAAALERDTLPAYEEFLAAYPGDPLARRVMAIVAARREAITWRRTYRADTPDAYWSYLRRYPRGPHAGDARRRLAILTAPLEPPPTFAMMDYDVPPPPPEEVVYVDRPVLYFSDPVFGFVPPPPPPVYYLPPPPPDFVVLPPPLPVVGLFVLPQPVFVPIPVFVRPPVYVAPPPNNIIYQNIHNTTVINTVINQAPAALAAGNTAAAAAVAANGPGRPSGMTQVPTAVKQQAQTIQANPNQQLKPSQAALVSNPTAKPAAMMVKPVNATPTAVNPSSTPPVGHGLPAQPPVQTPNGKPAPTTTAPAANVPPVQANAPAIAPAPGQPKQPDAHALPVPGAHGVPLAPGRTGAPSSAVHAPGGQVPGGKRAPNAPPPPTAAAPATSTSPTAGHPSGPGHAVAPPPASTTARPAATSVKPVSPPPPPPVARQQTRPEPPRAAAPPPRPQISARPAPAPPPPRAAPPPPRMAAPPPRPAPPVAAARPAPPPVARPAPPPPPRVVAAPPPRPAPPPPPRPAAAAPKKCPPNQPKC